MPLRGADRQKPGSRLQPPPRFTRSEPVQSVHHSNKLPCMSCKPHGLGFFDPTLWAYFSPASKALPSNHAYSPKFDLSSPNKYVVVVPARHAYSHSASVGRRYSSTAFSVPALRSYSVSFWKNFVTSSQETEVEGAVLVRLNEVLPFPRFRAHHSLKLTLSYFRPAQPE